MGTWRSAFLHTGGVFANFFGDLKMEVEGSQGSRKHHEYEDLDAPPICLEQPEETVGGTESTNPSSSGSKKRKGKKKKNKGSKKKNSTNQVLEEQETPLMPTEEYLAFARRVGIHFYAVRNVNMMHRTFIGLNEEGYSNLCHQLHEHLEQAFHNDERLCNWTDFYDHGAWLDSRVIELTTNTVEAWSYISGKKLTDRSNWTFEDEELVGKLETVKIFCQLFTKGRGKKHQPWKAKAEDVVMAHCNSGTFKWLESTVSVVSMPGQRIQGGYGKVTKVVLTKLQHIPSWIPFARKQLTNVDNERAKRMAMVNEAGCCPVKHPGIIRLSYLHPRTMEGFSLWWNGGSYKDFETNINRKVPPHLEYHEIPKVLDSGLSDLQLQWVVTFRKKRLELALSLLVIVGKCHDANYLHNDITPTNVLLHFDDWIPETVYIGLCDWGISSRVVEQAPSKYGYNDQGKLDAERKWRHWVAPELWFLYGPRNSENALDIMESRHLYSKAADAFSTGWLAQHIWQEEYDKRYFMPHRPDRAHNHEYLRYKLQGLQDPDVSKRLTVSDAIEALEKHPFSWTMPMCCFRNSAI